MRGAEKFLDLANLLEKDLETFAIPRRSNIYFSVFDVSRRSDFCLLFEVCLLKHNMATDLTQAKLLFKSGCFELCKGHLLELHSTNLKNTRILQKLGDVCLELKQIKEAEKYYRILLSTNSGSLDASYAKSLFQFGQFLFNEGQLEEAVLFLEKCCEIQNSGAAHYYLGLIRDGRSDGDRALYHYQMASKIRPEVVQYHFQLAKCLQFNCRYEEAMKSYEKALELTEHRDAEILSEYSQFQYQCMKNEQLALEFIQLATAIDERFGSEIKWQSIESHESPITITSKEEEPQIVDAIQCHDVRVLEALKTENKIKYSSLKCIIYDFDAAIQYLPLQEYVGGNLTALETMSVDDFLYIFGRRDRINRLRDHFEKLQSIKIRIGLSIPRNNDHYRNMVITALKRAYLYSYFEFIEDSYSIHGVAKRLQLKDDEILLISDRGDYQCPKRFGLSLHDLECIEQNLGFDVEGYTKFEHHITPSFLSRRNLKLYKTLRTQILRHDFYTSRNVHTLDAIQWIKQNATESPFLHLWTEFADKLMFATFNSHIHRVWIGLAVLETLLKVEPTDLEIASQIALFLNCLGRSVEAEIAFKQCIEAFPSTKILVDFAYFLYQHKRYEEALDTFCKALQSNPVSIKANIGMGRTLHTMGNVEEAEYYFLKALAIDCNHAMAHIRYGKWLYFVRNDLKGALYHYKVAERLRPDSDKTLHFLSRIYRELGKMKMAKECLIRCLSLNPSSGKSLKDYRDHFGDPDVLELDQKSFILSRDRGIIIKDKMRLFDGADDLEFGIFWIHHSEFFLRPDSAAFERYYFEFKRKGMFGISKLFDVDANVLSEVIGITNENHIELIVDCIDKYAIRQYEDFKNWLLKVVGDRQLGDAFMKLLFHQSAVYSFDSFGRNMKSEQRMYSILGPKHSIHSYNIWNAFAKEYS